MHRRNFLSVLGGAVAWPLVARAQQPAMPVIGFLSSGSEAAIGHMVAAFRDGLREGDYLEGRNVLVEYRWAEGHYERLSTMAADLVQRRVQVIAAVGGTVVALAAKSATKSIPIVFLIGDDPVKAGLVASFNRPDGNVTGVSQIAAALGAKRVELLHELAPSVTTIAFLINPDNPNADPDTREIQTAARAVGLQVHVFRVTGERDFGAAFAAFEKFHIGAVIVSNDALFTIRRGELVMLSARHGIPTIYAFREFTASGGLISYGPSFTDMYRQVGLYVGRILKGTTPADLPIMQPTKFELVINLKTAKALGLAIPPGLLSIADEVIE